MLPDFEKLHIKARTELRAFLNMSQIPGFQTWEIVARRWVENGWINEAAILLDMAAKYYDRNLVRTVSNRLLPVPANLRGRPITQFISDKSQPAIYTLRDHVMPMNLGDMIGLRAGNSLFLYNLKKYKYRLADVFSSKPVQAYSGELEQSGLDNPVVCCGLESFVLFAAGSKRLSLVDLSCMDWTLTDEAAQNTGLPVAYLDFPGNIHRIMGPLKDGTFFVTCAPVMPVFSDICILCQLDLDRIREYLRVNPNHVPDLDDIQAVRKFKILSNIEQTLVGDTCVADDCFMTCCGGMQNKEVRFIYSDGSWTTRFPHENPVIRMIPTSHGCVSLDKSGQAFLWSGCRVIDDWFFDLSGLTDLGNLEDLQLDFTLDWGHHRLFVTQTDTCAASRLGDVLNHSRSYCLDETGIHAHYLVKKLFPLQSVSLAMMSDGGFYFWNEDWDGVEPLWQLSERLADREDWQSLLKLPDSPAVECDPRIRWYRAGNGFE